ncbi:MAG: hypothetical protein KGI98_15655 [Euryarchaeota archaeon]|nr:hypothetical protein [Euryarchaeota archaeon]MDE1879470.1 hypothetical protein [Euryarchaeota archaeon]
MTGEHIYVSWADVEQMTYRLATRDLLPSERPEVIIGVASGGLIPAVMLAKFFKVERFLTVRAKHYHDGDGGSHRMMPTVNLSWAALTGLGRDLSRVWVVDDIVDTGETMRVVKEHIRGQASGGAEGTPRSVSLFWRSGGPLTCPPPDRYAFPVTSDAWVVFPWEWDGPAWKGLDGLTTPVAAAGGC